jgi:hypothetical protein
MQLPAMSLPAHPRRLAMICVVALAATVLHGPSVSGDVPGSNAPCNPRDTSGIMFYDEMVTELAAIEADSNGLVKVHDAGDSVLGRDLLYATVGSGPKTLFAWARIHGNEYVGTRPLLRALEFLGGRNPEARSLRRAVTLYAIPIWNPDGSEAQTREGAPIPDFPEGQDLNRDWYSPEDPLPPPPPGFSTFVYPESRAWYDVYAAAEPEYILDIHEFGGPEFVPGTTDLVQFQIGTAHQPEHAYRGQWLRTLKMGQVVLDTVQETAGSNPARYDLGSPSGTAPRSALRRMIHDGRGYTGSIGPIPKGGVFFEIPQTARSNDIAFLEDAVYESIVALIRRARNNYGRIGPRHSAEFQALPEPTNGTCN